MSHKIDLSAMPQDELEASMFSASLSAGIYDGYAPLKIGQPPESWPVALAKSVRGAFRFANATDSSVFVGNFQSPLPKKDAFDLAEPQRHHKILAVAFKGSDDLLDFLRDIRKDGPAAVRAGYENSSATRNLFAEAAKAVFASGASADEIRIAGHSLGGYAASEFLLELKRTAPEGWWAANASKIRMDALDPIGFSKEFMEASASGALSPAKIRSLTVQSSIAALSRKDLLIRALPGLGGNGLEDPFALHGPDVFKGSLAAKTSGLDVFNPLRPAQIHSSEFLWGAMVDEYAARRAAANQKFAYPPVEALGGKLVTRRQGGTLAGSEAVEHEEKIVMAKAP